VIALGVLLSVIPFFVTGRYRLPLAVALWPAAGLAVRILWDQRRNRRALGALAGGVVAYAGLTFFPLYHGGMARAHMLNIEGASLVTKGDLVRGRQAFERALEVNPNHAEALNNLAYTYVLEGDYPRALPYYRRAIALNPMQAETYFNLEGIYRKTGRNSDALEILNQLEAARGGTIEDVAAAVAYRRGVNHASLADTTAAIGYFEEAVERDPGVAGAWLNLSILRRKLGQDVEALAAAERAAAAAPGLLEARTNLGLTQENLHHYEEALASYRQAVTGATDPELHYRIGRVLLRLDRTGEAERELLEANQGRPHPAALWALAVLYEEQKRWDEAITAFTALTRIQAPTAKEAGERLMKIRHLGSPKR
jgi:tetratricopeptide (TPR) repeat protein